jgi:predicted methyltransferase
MLAREDIHMRKMLFLVVPFVALAALPAGVAAHNHDHHDHAAEPAAASPALAAVLADPRRAEDRARDAWRHPAATLGFFRVEPGMTVVDYTPGGGWWTRILVPYLGEEGRYIGLNPDVSGNAQMARFYANTAQTFPPRAAEWTGVPAERIAAYNTDGVPAALAGTVDRVLIFRALHNLHRGGMLQRELTAVRALLKPDGLLGIEQHRARADAPDEFVDGNKGYLREKDVIAIVEAQGFELVAKSEINANPNDPADHAQGVWTLPPNLRGVSEADKARYAAIGESDRMTLLFRKRG